MVCVIFAGPSVVVIQSNNTNSIMGGYTALDWDQTGTWKTDPQSFLFAFHDETYACSM